MKSEVRIAGAVGGVAVLLLGLAVASAMWGEPEVAPVVQERGRKAKMPAVRRGPLVRTDPIASRPPPASGPNVVVLLGCTVRKDQTSVYGGPMRTTPWMYELATQGAVFDDTIAAAPWTRAASTALLTGQHAISIGMIEHGRGRSNRRLPADVPTLATRFRSAGYTTVGGTANPNLNAVFGFHQGFDAYYEAGALWRKQMSKVGGQKLVTEVLGLLDDNVEKGRPFYLQLMMIDAHAPVTVTTEVARGWAGHDVPMPLAKYRVMLRRFDDAARKLDDALQARGYDTSNTVFVLAVDHGEGLKMPPHHGKGHGNYLYPSTTEVPWIVRGPGVAPGRRIGGLASQVDLVPTVLGLVELEGYRGPGQDWSGQLRGEADATTRTRAYIDTWYQSADRAAVVTGDRACQVDFGSHSPRKKKRPPSGQFIEGCFDRSDPDWKTVVRDADLTHALRVWRADRRREYDQATKIDADLDEDLNAQLEALGYIDPR